VLYEENQVLAAECIGLLTGEINGFRILTLLLVLALAAPFLYGLISADTPSTTAADIRKLDSLTAILEKPEIAKPLPGPVLLLPMLNASL
jgi:hypothetical protein